MQTISSIPHPYREVGEFFAANAMPIPRGDWRLTPYVQGAIHGLPSSRGWLVATDGIICFIRRSDDSLFCGHIAFFVTDKEPRAARSVPASQPTFDESLFAGF